MFINAGAMIQTRGMFVHQVVKKFSVFLLACMKPTKEIIRNKSIFAIENDLQNLFLLISASWAKYKPGTHTTTLYTYIAIPSQHSSCKIKVNQH